MAYQDGFPVYGRRPAVNHRGVPTPLAVHVHPYPTRYHGGIWTRPVTAPLPFMVAVQSVFKPDNFYEGNPGLMRMGVKGLGDVAWQTNRGVYGAQRDGGGIFSPSAVYGLGEFITSVVMPKIDSGTAVPQTGTSAPPLASKDPRVKSLQSYLNKVLASAAYAPIGVDGDVGPQTCGAIAWYKATGRSIATGTTRDRIDENLSYLGAYYDKACAAKKPWKPPAKPSVVSVKPAPSTAPASQPPPLAYQPPMSTATKAVIGMGVGALVVGGGYWLARKKGMVR